MNCKQDHNDNDIRHIFIKKKKCNEQHKYIKKEKINARMKLNTYLHEYTLQWKNTIEIKDFFNSFRPKIFYLQKRSS